MSGDYPSFNENYLDTTWLCVPCAAKRKGCDDHDRVAQEIGVYRERKKRNEDNAYRREKVGFSIPQMRRS